MSEAHTPGPWTAQKDGTRVYAGNVRTNTPHCIAGHSSLVRVAECDDIDDTSKDTARRIADARLIAAAPDLLAACKAQYDAIHKVLRYFLGTGPQPQPEDFVGVIAQSASAMLKAEGGAA